MKPRKRLLSLVVLSLALTFCVGCSASSSMGLGPAPEKVVRQWFEAVGEFDVPRMHELTHPAKRADLELALENPLVTVGAALGLAKQDFFEMSYTVASNDGKAAEVRATGKVTNRLGRIDDVDEVIELRKLDSQWYIWFTEEDL